MEAWAGLTCGSGGIRTPGASRHARFQDSGEPCVGVCAELSTCEFSSKTCAEACSAWQSVATRLLQRRSCMATSLAVVLDRSGKAWVD